MVVGAELEFWNIWNIAFNTPRENVTMFEAGSRLIEKAGEATY
jgi:hypothetical protein